MTKYTWFNFQPILLEDAKCEKKLISEPDIIADALQIHMFKEPISSSKFLHLIKYKECFFLSLALTHQSFTTWLHTRIKI